MSLLYTKALRREFGGVIAVADVDFEVKKGSITGLIGPNGAGKTTLFNNITGMDIPTEGHVFFDGEDITGLPAYKITRKGIARTFQNIRLFKGMSVFENVMIGRHFKGTHSYLTRFSFVNAFLGMIFRRQEEVQIYEHSVKWLKFFNLMEYHNELAQNLPYGRQRELEIARAMATEPKLLFLDEPAAGMNPQETKDLMNTICKIRDAGVTVVLIEHDMKLVMNICDRITVLNSGKKIADGTPEEIQNNDEVIKAYLGTDE